MEFEGGRPRRGSRFSSLIHLQLLKSVRGRKTAWKASILLLIFVLFFIFAIRRRRIAFDSGGLTPRESSSLQKDVFKPRRSTVPGEEFLGGLLADGFADHGACRSRYQSGLLRNPSPHKPSAYLIKRLRQYEAIHRKCGPHTHSYNVSAELLRSVRTSQTTIETECKYVLWTPAGGLGNRMISLASTFLYALLSGRVLLIDRGQDFSNLMCEPFPGTSWLLPLDFPISNMRSFGLGDALSYSSLLRGKKIINDVNGPVVSARRPQSFVYIHLVSGFTLHDSLFFCEEDQIALREVPWLLIRSDNYFVPGLFVNAFFEPELRFMFQDKEAVFHHLCRYLFHPNNRVWDMVTGYYQTRLAQSEEIVGIQIRVFDKKAAPFEVVLKQVINCTLTEKILPEVNAKKKKKTAVLITSLYSGYLERFQEIYQKDIGKLGEGVISFFQPSHEGRQVKDDEVHDMKAWTEMSLLGLADVLVTTARSTFGYVGQALAGVEPWILVTPEKATVPEPSCIKEMSLDPCFQDMPQYICKEKKNGDTSKLVPYITRCKDVPSGVKLVNRTVW
ncbi:galactoside 2-alpha-L-fucosyltransferase-like [Wolffia australiana]